MFPVPIFPSWRHLWNRDEITKDLAEAGDSLARRRNQISAGTSEVRELHRLAPRLREFLRLHQERAELKEKDPARLCRSYLLGIAEFHPIIEAARWARWLLLEEALADAMRYGDLLFGALVLRTQIEDLGMLRRLQQVERDLRAKRSATYDASAVADNGVAAIEEIMDFLWERFLPRFRPPTREEMGSRKQNDLVIQPLNELAESFSALNDYVHPNYGSHMTTIFPETSASGRTLLTAFKAIYGEFFRLDFVQRCAVGQAPESVKPPVSYVSTLRRFAERTLPRLDRKLRKERGYTEDWAPQPLSIFKDRLERETGRPRVSADGFLSLKEPKLRSTLEERASTLRSLCSAIEPDQEWPTEETVRFVEKRTAPVVAINTAMWLLLAHMRDLARRLESEAKQLPADVLFPKQPPFDRWIGFTGDAIWLAIFATYHKIELMHFAALRMVNQANPLGAFLCARSILEHYAVAKELAERFKKGVESIEETARSGRDIVAQFERLEQTIGRFLISTKGTSELETKWKERWTRLGIKGHVNLVHAVERAFPRGDSRGFLYAYFSRCAHGDLLTGADLLRPGSELGVAINLGKVVMVLADAEAMGWTLDYWSPVLAGVCRLTRPMGAADAVSFDELRQALRKGTTFGQPLKPGRDVLGQGTEADPYRFRDDLQYYETFYQFCHEHGIDLTRWKRTQWWSGGKLGDCLTGPDGQTLYFRFTRNPWTS